MDRGARDFFAMAPIVLDCRGDAENFRRRLTERQLATVSEQYEEGRLRYVSSLHRPPYQYARDQIEERYENLNKDGQSEVLEFLDQWRLEIGKQEGQLSRDLELAAGVDIILPISGARVSYDYASIFGLT
jgi:hypothetical protein